MSKAKESGEHGDGPQLVIESQSLITLMSDASSIMELFREMSAPTSHKEPLTRCLAWGSSWLKIRKVGLPQGVCTYALWKNKTFRWQSRELSTALVDNIYKYRRCNHTAFVHILSVWKLISERSSGLGGSCDSEFRRNMVSVLFFLEFWRSFRIG